jgi:ribonucleoside-triphosphate reductase
MNPSRDAGKFAYHLKFLLNSNLVEANSSSKKYFLTDLGKMVIDIADKVEKRAFSQRGMLVRTSHFTLEEFDLNKITKSITKEAKVPPELAQKTAKEAEKRLRKSKAKYITAPLVREIVNTILVEKGYENYRHKLTRMGLPVYEVTQLLNSKKLSNDSTRIILEAGKKVFEEYVLLNIFPRDIADAHLLGGIHAENLGTWILKPKEIIHDIRFFYECGLNLPKISDLSIDPPKDLDSALTITLNVLLYCKKEVNSTQTLESFNLFLSPFVQDRNIKKIKNSLRRFLINISQNIDTTISLDLSIPKVIANINAIGPEKKSNRIYADLLEENQLLATLIIEIFAEESSIKPLFNPKIIIKISEDSFNDKNILKILRKAHNLAFERGNIFFENLTHEKTSWKVFSATGIKLSNDLSGDWETDTLRTGCLGIVAINLPRIVQESENDQEKFFEILKERFELSARALRIKYNALKQIGKISLPFMTQKTKGDTYFRFEQCSRIINFVGFQEAVEKFSGKKMNHEDSKKFAIEIVKNALKFKRKIGRKYGKRLFPVVLPSMEASKRLASLDIEKFGVAKVRFSGTRYTPFFSSSKRLELQCEPISIKSESIQIESEISGLNAGGCLYIIDLVDVKFDYEELLNVTKKLIKYSWVEFFTFNRVISFCENCQKNWQKSIQKCPSCGSLSTMKTFDRFRST